MPETSRPSLVRGVTADRVGHLLAEARVPAEGVGPHPWPRALGERAAGEQDLTVLAEQVAREGEVQGGVETVDRGAGRVPDTAAVLGEEDHVVVDGGGLGGLG